MMAVMVAVTGVTTRTKPNGNQRSGISKSKIISKNLNYGGAAYADMCVTGRIALHVGSDPQI